MNSANRRQSIDEWLSFHCCVHGSPSSRILGRRIDIEGQQIDTIEIQRPLDPLPLSFEQIEASLIQIPGLHFEPDGWFVWGEGASDQRWQVDGQLFDRGERVGYVELRGTCPESQFDVLMQAFGASESTLIMQLVQQGVYTDVDSMKRIAMAQDSVD